MTKPFTLVIEDGYIKVKHGLTTICAAIAQGKTLHNIAFVDPKHHKCNKTRQAAMRVYQQSGYK